MGGLNLQSDSGPDDYIPWRPADDWTLLIGQHIEVHNNGQLIDRGEVEAATADGHIMWLALEGASPRRLIEKLPGTHLRTAAGGPAP